MKFKRPVHELFSPNSSAGGECRNVSWLGETARATRFRIQPTPHWSERYANAVDCGGQSFLFTRMAGFNATKRTERLHWRTLVRHGGAPFNFSKVHETFESYSDGLTHNVYVVCLRGVLVAYGGRFRREWGELGGIRRYDSPSRWPPRWAKPGQSHGRGWWQPAQVRARGRLQQQHRRAPRVLDVDLYA